MTTKHTPEPWLVSLEDGRVSDSDYRDLLAEWDGKSLEERVANADLIKASPKLLAASIAVMREHAGKLTGSDSFTALCEAVTKANGNG